MSARGSFAGWIVVLTSIRWPAASQSPSAPPTSALPSKVGARTTCCGAACALNPARPRSAAAATRTTSRTSSSLGSRRRSSRAKRGWADLTRRLFPGTGQRKASSAIAAPRQSLAMRSSTTCSRTTGRVRSSSPCCCAVCCSSSSNPVTAPVTALPVAVSVPRADSAVAAPASTARPRGTSARIAHRSRWSTAVPTSGHRRTPPGAPAPGTGPAGGSAARNAARSRRTSGTSCAKKRLNGDCGASSIEVSVTGPTVAAHIDNPTPLPAKPAETTWPVAGARRTAGRQGSRAVVNDRQPGGERQDGRGLVGTGSLCGRVRWGRSTRWG